MRLRRYIEQQFVREYLVDLDPEAASRRCGIVRSPRHFGYALLDRVGVKQAIAKEMEARRIRLEIDADFVLAELVRQYLRLKGLLGHDLAEVIDECGNVLPVKKWPEVWRKSLVTEYQTEPAKERSHDGEQREDSPSWDTVGTKIKIKRERVLEIEREIRATLKLIGEHMKVQAFPVPGQKIAQALNDLAYTFRWKSSPDEIVDVTPQKLEP